MAQAFHWFDPQPALREIGSRAPSRAACLAMVWNARDEREPWVQRLSDIVGVERVGTDDLRAEVARSGLFGPLEEATFAHEQRVDRAHAARARRLAQPLRDAWSRRSATACWATVGRVFDEFATDGEVVLPYIVDAYRARLL